MGLFVGFFAAFNVLFSDVFGVSQMLGALAYVLVAYALLGLAFGAVGPGSGWRWVPWLAAPGALAGILSLGDGGERALYALGVVLATVGGTLGGVLLGAWVRKKLSRSGVTPSG
jgi:hypothetical protein